MKSMTAYAYVYKKNESQTIQLTLRSTNFKYLEVSVHNLHPGQIVLEEKIKREIKKKISRGKIEIHIFLKRPIEGKIHVEEKILDQYVMQAKKIAKKYGLTANLDVSRLLNLPQVIWWEEETEKEGNLVLPVVIEGVNKLLEFKKREGEAIKGEMNKNLKKLKANIKNMKKNKPAANSHDNDKTDIDEELSLLLFYSDRLDKLINSEKQGVGKSIDFLTQEILRELNTASSKTNQHTLASFVVESKTYIERIREQAQNVE